MFKDENSTTGDESTPTNRSRQSSIEFSRGYINMKQIIQSNEQIIFEQSRKITELAIKLEQASKLNDDLHRKLEILTEVDSNQEEEKTEKSLSQRLLEKINDLEKTLVLAKIESATKDQEILTARDQLKKMKNRRNSLRLEEEERHHLTKSKIMHMIDTKNKFRLDLKFTRQSNLYCQEDIEQWGKCLNIIHPLKSHAWRRIKEKSKGIVRRFIPKQIRQRAWPVYIHNQLAICKDYYRQLVQNASVPNKVRTQIQNDIDRSFPENQVLKNDKALLDNVQDMLQLFHCFRPDISYVQGMTYPATILLLVTMDKYTAFKCFCNLIISNEFLYNLYSFNIKKISLYCKTFDHLLEDTVPWLFEQLSDLNINTEMFLIEWFYTFFGRAFSLATVLKVWDWLIYYGEVTLFKTALAIFDTSQQYLRDQPYQTCIQMIKSFGANVTESKITEHIVNSKLTSEKIETIMSKVATKNDSEFQDDMF